MSVSFVHRAGEHLASYRYRTLLPANMLGWKINDLSAETLIFTKPWGSDYDVAIKHGGKVIVDVCDDRIEEYGPILRIAHKITCPTDEMKKLLSEHGYESSVIHDTYIMDEVEPHCNGTSMFWFGCGNNLYSIRAIESGIVAHGYQLRIMSNSGGCIPWSVDGFIAEASKSDIVAMPSTARWKSPNRTIEAIRMGCFVCAEPHPAINDIEGIYIGDIVDGAEWVQSNMGIVNDMVRHSQRFIMERYSPDSQAALWAAIV